MLDFLKHLFSRGDFIPQGHCYLWRPEIVWLHVVSHGVEAVSYAVIPFALYYFVRRRRDLPFDWMVLWFALFIVACGASHVLEIWTVWTPMYRFSGLVKALTAAVTLPTALLLVKLVPRALTLPSPAMFRRAVDEQSGGERRFRALTESATEAIVTANDAGLITYVNGATEDMFGHPVGSLLGRPLTDLMPERFRDAHRADLQRFLAGGDARVIGNKAVELIGLCGDGAEFPIELSLATWRIGDTRSFSAIIRDVTERKAAETVLLNARRSLEERTQQLEAANHELEAFSYSVAHDLRTPLRGISGFSQVLLDDYQGYLDGQAQNYLHRICANSLKMAELIDALLSLSRTARSTLKPQRVDLSALMRHVGEELAGSEPGRVVTWVIQEGLHAHLDPALAYTLISNLAGNAWKFTAKKARAQIEFGATNEGGVETFFVRDNGAGFDMAFQDKLFAPFQRLHSATEFRGTGIGLATVFRIVQRHGGQVWADGRVDQGAAFHFTLSEPVPAAVPAPTRRSGSRAVIAAAAAPAGGAT